MIDTQAFIDLSLDLLEQFGVDMTYFSLSAPQVLGLSATFVPTEIDNLTPDEDNRVEKAFTVRGFFRPQTRGRQAGKFLPRTETSVIMAPVAGLDPKSGDYLVYKERRLPPIDTVSIISPYDTPLLYTLIMFDGG